MKTDDKLIKIYNEAYKYLLQEVGEKILTTELNHYIQYTPTSLNDIFRGMVVSLKNKQGYMNFIGKTEDMRDILKDFDPKTVNEMYKADWEKLAIIFKEKFGGKFNIDLTNNKNAWVMYSKGVLSCAQFLTRFASLEDFDTFVRSFFYNEYTVAALPMVLDKEIFGFGFALACDFLKEQGYTKYAKPDLWLKRLFTVLDMAENDSEYEIFKQAVKIAKLAGTETAIVDKVFWLIGTGNFNSQGINIEGQSEKFIEYVKYFIDK